MELHPLGLEQRLFRPLSTAAGQAGITGTRVFTLLILATLLIIIIVVVVVILICGQPYQWKLQHDSRRRCRRRRRLVVVQAA